MIKFSEICVVIQGPIIKADNLTVRVIESIKENLKGAQVIISTWEHEDISGLFADLIIKNVDPGGININEQLMNNVNRQIVTVKEGINASDRKYILKIRSDTLIKSGDFVEIFEQYSNYKQFSRFNFFSKKILVTRYFFRDPIFSKFLFHPSDIILFGLRQDLYDLFDCKLASESDLINFKSATIFRRIKYSPEQYIWIKFLNKHNVEADIEFSNDVNYRNFLLSELTLLNNFIIINLEIFDVVLPPRMQIGSSNNLYSNLYWKFFQRQSPLIVIPLITLRFVFHQLFFFIFKRGR